LSPGDNHKDVTLSSLNCCSCCSVILLVLPKCEKGINNKDLSIHPPKIFHFFIRERWKKFENIKFKNIKFKNIKFKNIKFKNIKFEIGRDRVRIIFEPVVNIVDSTIHINSNLVISNFEQWHFLILSEENSNFLISNVTLHTSILF